jgi:hypothetical protein
MGSRRWYEVPSGKVRVLSRKGSGSMLFDDDDDMRGDMLRDQSKDAM